MKTYIALFRGINVGGHNLLPMRKLVSILESLGLANVETYIQSGNAIFKTKSRDAAKLVSKIRTAIHKAQGFKPALMLLSVDELKQAVDSNPFVDAQAEPNRLHLFFLGSAPSNPDLAGIENLKSSRERHALIGSVFYLHAPDGIGRSKLAAKAEKLLGVAATGRNWRTVLKVLEMAGSDP